eukprot:TRINITY_DN1386_c0_g1_i1.p1 TRINITY_DN1386_c0_g1~~TRINITY_DN1386_c0_g1_i1.p1  ORF type:complete len:265 (+),score=39.10 TRINITY_DN1386_c0_g1_i1:455-1249(+)
MLSMFQNGDLAYAVLGGGTVRVLNVSNPLSPVLVRTLALKSNCAIHIHGTTAYEVDDNNKELTIVDISGAVPTQLGSMKTAGYTNSIATTDNTLYHDNSIGGVGRWLSVIDVSTPSAPVLRGQLNLTRISWSPTAIAVAGDRVYIGDSNVTVVDVSNPSSPRKVGDYAVYEDLYSDLKLYSISISRGETRLTTGLGSFDVTSQSPQLTGTYGASPCWTSEAPQGAREAVVEVVDGDRRKVSLKMVKSQKVLGMMLRLDRKGTAW